MDIALYQQIWPPHLTQLLKARFESSNSTYSNALSNLSEKTLTFYRKALKDLSMTLVEAVSELWKERAEEIEKLGEQSNTMTPNENDHYGGRRHPLPADQPTIVLFCQTPQTENTSTTTSAKTTPSDKGMQPIRQRGRLQHRTKN